MSLPEKVGFSDCVKNRGYSLLKIKHKYLHCVSWRIYIQSEKRYKSYQKKDQIYVKYFFKWTQPLKYEQKKSFQIKIFAGGADADPRSDDLPFQGMGR